MIKLGQTTTGTGRGCKYLWLVKDIGIYNNWSKKECYVVLGFHGGGFGWMTLFNGTLKQCRAFIGDEKVVDF